MSRGKHFIRAAQESRAAQGLAFLVLLLALYVLQGLPYFTDPVLFGKDIALGFEHFYGGARPISDIFRQTQGYFSLTLYFIPWCLARFSTALQPWLYSACAINLYALPMAVLFASTLFRGLAARVCFTLLVAFWYYWDGAGDEPGTLFVTASMSFWPVCLLYFLLVLQMLADRHDGCRVLALSIAALPALVSHPYTIAALPALVYLAWGRAPRTTRACALALILLSFGYAATHDGSKSDLLALLTPGAFLDYLQYLINDVLLLGLVHLPRYAAILAAIAVTLAALIYERRHPKASRMPDARDGFILIFIAGLSALYFASYRYPQYGLEVPVRYSIVQQILWLVFLLRRVEGLPVAVHAPRRRAGLWAGLTLLVLLLRGGGGEACFVHLRGHEVAVHREYFALMGRLEAVVAQHPEVAWILYVPGHQWPTRRFLIGSAQAAAVIDGSFQDRDATLRRLRDLGVDAEAVLEVARGLERYGVETNFARNYRFEAWGSGRPEDWDVVASGAARILPESYGDPPLPALALQLDAPGSSVMLTQTIEFREQPHGAGLRVQVHTRAGDAVQLRMLVAARTDLGWQPIADAEGRTGPYWALQRFDLTLPQTSAPPLLQLRITATVSEKATALLSNVVVTNDIHID